MNDKNPDALKDWLTIAAAILALFAMSFGAFSLTASMLIAGGMAVVSLIFAFIGDIAEFKASATGIEAKMRAVVRDAEAKLVQLQELAALSVKAQVATMMRANRFVGRSTRDRDNLIEEMKVLLSNLGLTKEAIGECFEEVRQYTAFDYVQRIGEKIGNDFPQEVIPSEEWLKFRTSSQLIQLPGDVEAFLKEWKLFTPAREELLRDYEFYLREGNHRRPEVWHEED